MQTRKDDSAFPKPDGGIHSPCLTKREYFAALALQGLLADGIEIDGFAADLAVAAADRLIYELNKTDSEGEADDKPSNPS